MTEPVELRYRMTPDTLFQAAFGWMVRRPEGGAAFLPPWLLFVSLLLLAAILADHQAWLPPGVSSGFILGIGLMLLSSSLAGVLGNRRIKGLYEKSYVGNIDVVARLDSDGVIFRDAKTEACYDWTAIDDVIALRSATGLRLGASTLSIPDSGVPPEMTPLELRQRIRDWIAAKDDA